MYKTLIACIAAGVVSLSGYSLAAAKSDFTKLDANHDGHLSMTEVKAANPDWTAAAFKKADKDGNGSLSQQEYDSAMMTKSSG